MTHSPPAVSDMVDGLRKRNLVTEPSLQNFKVTGDPWGKFGSLYSEIHNLSAKVKCQCWCPISASKLLKARSTLHSPIIRLTQGAFTFFS
jgi:hypothetical protein